MSRSQLMSRSQRINLVTTFLILVTTFLILVTTFLILVTTLTAAVPAGREAVERLCR